MNPQYPFMKLSTPETHAPGQYLRVAKMRGYSVIEFDPTPATKIFSTNCKLNCKIDAHSMQISRCGSCGNELCLYADPIMLMFEGKVRIDLANQKYCYLPVSSKIWEDLPKVEDCPLTHLQYIKAMATLNQKQTDLKQMLTNYYNYKVMPVAIPKSYWQHEITSLQSHYCILASAASHQQVEVLVGEDQLYFVQVEGQVLCSALSHGFLVLAVKTTSVQIYAYQLPNISTPQIIQQYLFAISLPENMSDLCLHRIEFHHESLYLVMSEGNKEQSSKIEVIRIVNILSNSLQIYKVEELESILNHGQAFPFLLWGEGKVREPKVYQIQLLPNQICVMGPNINSRVKECVDWKSDPDIIVDAQNHTIYLLYVEKKETQTIKIQINERKAEVKVSNIGKCKFVVREIEECGQGKKTIIMRKPALQGCIATLHILQNKKIYNAQTCLV